MNQRNKESIVEHLSKKAVVDNIFVRHQVKQLARNFFCDHGFMEVDTPTLSKALDEYTTNHFKVEGLNGSHTLPQSPQIYAQLVVILAVERYFQFPHCYRDEEFDPDRTDQLPEFMQIDFEMRTGSASHVRSFGEQLVSEICDGLDVECSIPFPVITAEECESKYGTDKPDLRKEENENKFLWVIDFPMAEKNSNGELKPPHHVFALPKIAENESLPGDLVKVKTHTYDLVLNGMEIGGGNLDLHRHDVQLEALKRFGYDIEQFSPLLEALEKVGAPPHGGMAIGLDRLIMQLTRTEHIRDVQAF